MLVLVGSNHRSAPVAVRERMSFPLERLPEAHARLQEMPGIAEGMILSTCNRVEVLAWTDGAERTGLDALRDFLAREHRLGLEEVDRYTYQLLDGDAVRHLFAVASGLDSMIMGEPQILGQVKQAYQLGREHGTIGPVLDRLMQHCLSAAKKVRTETGISRNAVSVAFAAVELARKIFGDLHGRSALLLGAGKMGDLVGRHLVSNGVSRLAVASRTFTNAAVAAERIGGRAIPWEDGLTAIRETDIVVSCTGAPRIVLTKDEVARALRGRRKGPLFLIDIAVPRDIDPGANELDNVYLYDIDGLQGVVESNLEERRAAAEHAKHVVAAEAAAFARRQQEAEISPMIVALREELLGIGQREIERFRRKLGPLDPTQEDAVGELTRAVIQKILHRPIVRLRQSVERGDTPICVNLYRDIFGVEAGAGAAPEADDAPPGPRRVIEGGKKDGSVNRG